MSRRLTYYGVTLNNITMKDPLSMISFRLFKPLLKRSTGQLYSAESYVHKPKRKSKSLLNQKSLLRALLINGSHTTQFHKTFGK